MEFKDKICVVTGGGQGLGRDVCHELAQEGAIVHLVGRTEAPLVETKEAIEAAGGVAFSHVGDMADPNDIDRIATTIIKGSGRVDVLVNNAAIGGPSGPMWELDLKDWDETLRINTTGPFLTSRAFLPGMIKQKSGSIVFVGSMTGKRPLLNRTVYAASKIAVVGLARTLAWEVGPYNIRVNVVSPGPMEGERMQWVLEKQAQEQGVSVDEARSRLTANSPFQRFVATSDVVNAITYFASGRSGSTTGEDLNVSSGICMY